MGDNGASGNASGLLSGWRVKSVSAKPLPQGVYSMIELDAQTCALERPGGPSFEMLAADVVTYVLHVIGPLAGNDNATSALPAAKARGPFRPRRTSRARLLGTGPGVEEVAGRLIPRIFCYTSTVATVGRDGWRVRWRVFCS